MSSLVGGTEAAFADHLLGLSSDASLDDALNRLRFLESPGGRQWWFRNKANFNSHFSEWLAKNLSLSPDAG